MKFNFTNLVKTRVFILFLLAPVLFIGCQKEDDNFQKNTDSQIEKGTEDIDYTDDPFQIVNFKDLPNDIKGLFDKERSLNIEGSSSKNSDIIFGKARTDIPSLMNDYEGRITYTVALTTLRSDKKSSQNRYYDNLVIEQMPDGSVNEHIFRYTPERQWLDGDRSMSDYTGKINILKFDGTSLGISIMSDGELVRPGGDEGTSSTRGACSYEYEYKLCVGQTDGKMHCTLYFRFAGCGGGASGGSSGGFPNNGGSGNGSDGDSGGSGGHGGGTGTGGGNGDGTDGGSGGIGGGNPIIDDNGQFIEEEVQIINELTDKAKCVYDKMVDSQNDINWITENFKDTDGPSEFDLKFMMSSALDDRTNASSQKIGDLFIIKINSNTLAGRTTLGLARTLLHEGIHARLREFAFREGSTEKDFPGVYDYFRIYKKNWDHQQMADFYRETIAEGLKQFDNNQHSEDFYMDMAWEGLGGKLVDHNDPNVSGKFETEAWKALTPEEQDRIINVINYEKENGIKNCN